MTKPYKPDAWKSGTVISAIWRVPTAGAVPAPDALAAAAAPEYLLSVTKPQIDRCDAPLFGDCARARRSRSAIRTVGSQFAKACAISGPAHIAFIDATTPPMLI